MTGISGFSTNREFLESIIAGEFKLPDGADPFHFCMDLLPNLGASDPVLRDDLSATIVDNLVSDTSRITGEQAGHILSVLLDGSHLFQRIGEEGTDSVFMRSFSALISSSILYRDSMAPSIGMKLVGEAIGSLLQYSTEERDFRGFIEGKGWAHSVAHLSDALYASAVHPAANRAQLNRILEVTGELSMLNHPLSSGEPERLAHASGKALESMNDPGAAMEWIGGYPVLEIGKGIPYARFNSANFLRTLYFDIKWDKGDSRFLDALEEKFRQLDPLHRE